jgi:hypothetical protein
VTSMRLRVLLATSRSVLRLARRPLWWTLAALVVAAYGQPALVRSGDAITMRPVRLDHVIYAVADLQGAVRRFAEEYALESVGGGEHLGFGTRNSIVPVGHGQFIELMAIAEEGSQHPLVRSLSAWLRDGDCLVAVCLRPDDLDEVAERLSIPITPAERHDPGGEVLRWRLAGVQAALGPERLPFFIDWDGAEQQLDSRHAQAASTDGIAWVEYGGDAGRLSRWIGEHDLPLRIVEGPPGPHAIGLRRGPETVVIR